LKQNIYYIGSAEGHEYPALNRLSDNSISGQKYVKIEASKALKCSKEGNQLLLTVIVGQPLKVGVAALNLILGKNPSFSQVSVLFMRLRSSEDIKNINFSFFSVNLWKIQSFPTLNDMLSLYPFDLQSLPTLFPVFLIL
jgi:hypothetical protein